MTAYYNEFDPDAADKLEYLITQGLIAPGIVDRRSIVDVRASDLKGFCQCHFFAGVGGWSVGLRLAGVPDTSPVWTASLPCQPFSIAATSGTGQADDRHLLPDFMRLVAECDPAIIFGEQVKNAIKWGWLDELYESMEALGHACGSAVVPAIAVGARHERKRLYWVADARGSGRAGYQPIECLPVAAAAALALYGDPLAGAWRALDGDFSGLLPCDGLSVAMERAALKGYGNAIIPKLAAQFVGAYLAT